jgi:hypothetical protein
MLGKRFLVPWICAAGAMRNVLGTVQKGGTKCAIRAPGEIDHVVGVFAGVAMHEEAGTRWTASLALFGIPPEPIAASSEADREVKPIAEPDTQRPICAAFVARRSTVVSAPGCFKTRGSRRLVAPA